jgi:hypothetical protein
VIGDLTRAGHTRLAVTLGVSGVHAEFDSRKAGSH